MVQQYRRNPERPLGPDRQSQHRAIMTRFHNVERDMELSFERTQDIGIYRALQDMRVLRRDIERILLERFWEREDAFRAEEEEEFYRFIGNWADSVRWWMIHYEEKELK